MENKNKILIGLSAIAAAFIGKKMYDKRRGSGAMYLFPVPARDRFATEQEAFFAFMQRRGEDGKARTARYKNPQSRREWMKNLGPSGAYDISEFEGEGLYSQGGRADEAYYAWQRQWADGYIGGEGAWSQGKSSDSDWDGAMSEDWASKAQSFKESDETWSGTTTDDWSSGFGFPDVNAQRFRK